MDKDELSVLELKQRLERGEALTILDVREPHEHRICNIGGVLIPLGMLEARIQELDPSGEIAVICHHGFRSRRAVDFLKSRGFTRVLNVTGGIEAWAVAVDPEMRRY